MLAKERHSRIVQDINAAGFVSVKDLSARYQVTEDCIRKDLRTLEDAHLIERIHGGAAAIRTNVHAYDARSRQDQNTAEKEIVADKAIALIEDHETVFLDISTISLRMAVKLAEAKRHVTVATNMTAILDVLKEQDTVRLQFIGGSLNDTHDGFTGALTVEAMKNLRFDKAFLGVVGLNIEEGSVFTYDPDDALTKKTVLSCANESYMIFEHEKFQREGHCVYAALDDFTGLICDEVKEREKKMLNASGIRMI